MMTLQGRVENGVVVLTGGRALPDGTLVNVTPVGETAGLPAISPDRLELYPVTDEQRTALLGLIGIWKTDNPPDDEEVERIVEEYRINKYG